MSSEAEFHQLSLEDNVALNVTRRAANPALAGREVWVSERERGWKGTDGGLEHGAQVRGGADSRPV